MSNYPKYMRFESPLRWYVLVSRVDANIFAGRGVAGKLEFIEKFVNPEGLLQERELVSDKPGRKFSSSRSGVRHDVGQQTPHHEMSARRFVRKMSKILAEAYEAKLFEELVLVAEPHTLGLLRKALPKKLQTMVRHEVGHEYRASDKSLGKKIQTAIAER